MMVSWSVDEKIAQSTVKAGPAFLSSGGGTVIATAWALSTQISSVELITMYIKIVTLVLSAASVRKVNYNSFLM